MKPTHFAGLSRMAVGLAAILALVLAAEGSGLASALDRHLLDQRFRLDRRAATGDVVLVDIDARSLAEIGVWPWPRHLYADFVDAAARLGAARIAFDVDFSAASSPAADEAFAAALKRSSAAVFLAAFVQNGDAATRQLFLSLPIALLLDAAWPALVNVPIDPDNKVRRFPSGIDLDGERLASMPAALADGSATVGDVGIDFGIDPSTLRRVSFVDVVQGRVAPDLVRNKTVIVGAAALELRDLFAVPAHGVVSGSTIIALAAETLLQGRSLKYGDPPRAAAVALTLLALFAFRRWRSWRVALVPTALAVLIEAAAFAFHVERGLVVPTARLHVVLAGFAAFAVLREIDLRGLLLRVARIDAGNQRALLERVVEDGFDGVLILDGAKRVSRINDAARAMLGHGVDRFDDLPPPIRNALRDVLDDGVSPEAPARRTFEALIESNRAESRVVECGVSRLRMEQAGPAAERSPAAVFVYVALRDVTARRRAEDALRRAALQDALTGLANRRALDADLSASHGEADAALIAFDLDRFKSVNDALGYAVGDAVLVETARRAKNVFPDLRALARTGGDEFCLLAPAASPQAALDVAGRLAAAMDEPFHVAGHQLALRANVGVSWEAAGSSDGRAMRRADAALRSAKQSGERRPVLFDPEMETRRAERLAIERDLARALDAGEFELFYQPQVGLASGAIVGAEALLRWRHPRRGLVSPDVFIPILEETGLIHGVGAWALATACRQALTWPASMKVAVNVSSVQFAAGDLVGAVAHALDASRLSPERLELEITESAFVAESNRLASIFERLLDLGLSFSLDDFGTGYSSLGYLHRFPIAKIKVDRSFVTGVPLKGDSMAILRSVKALADGLGLRLIAEGIETDLEAETLRIMGFDDGQGFLFAKPLDAASLKRFLLGGRVDPNNRAPPISLTA